MQPRILALVLAATCAPVLAADSAPPEVAYPSGYRDWHHVKTMIINPGHALYDAFGGIHHLYANKQAVSGYKNGKFANGSVIVFDLLETTTADNTIQEGARKVVGVMRKDAKKYAATGGWGFEGFKGDSKTERAVTQQNADSACFRCHIAQKERDFVFSGLRP